MHALGMLGYYLMIELGTGICYVVELSLKFEIDSIKISSK
jgi:hypothetical protein